MAVITQLVAQKKNNERISVFVNNEFFCGLKVDDAISNSLVVGLELSEAELSSLLLIAGENDMFNKALVYILKNPRTESEVKRFLQRKECSNEMTTRIVDRLKTNNYINDEAYARMFAAQKHVKMSIRAIKHKLRTKGVNSELAGDIVENYDNESEIARGVAEKYMRYRDYDEKNLQRLYRYLVAKGFGYDLVSEIVSDYRNKREIDPKTKAEFKSRYDEYRLAREMLITAKRDAARTKRSFRAVQKKVVNEMK